MTMLPLLVSAAVISGEGHCPVREEARRDTIGEAIEIDRYRQSLHPGAWRHDRARQPFANPELHGLGLREVRQGQDVYRWSDEGWDDAGALVSVHDLAGRTLCARRYVDLGSAGGDVWPKLLIAAGMLTCPDGRRAKVPAWDPRLARR